jgi:hypothetical protein
VIITFEGRQYPFDLDDLTVKQALKIEKHIGGTLLDWENGLNQASGLALQALGWLIFTGGDSTPIADVEFKIMKLAAAFADAAAAQATEAEAEMDPTNGPSTQPVGTSPNGAAASVPVSSLKV